MKKEWTYKQKGLRNSQISINSLLLRENLIFAIAYDKNGFYESQLIFLNLETKEENIIMKIPHVIRNVPVLSDGNLYFTAFNGNFYCLDEDTFAIKWTTKFGTGNPGFYVCVNDSLAFSFNKELFCFNKFTGEILWQFKHNSNHSGCNIIVKGNLLFHGLSNGYLYCFAIKEQKIVWTFGENIYFRSCMIIGELLLACATNGNIYVVDASTGKLIFTFDTGDAIYVAPTYINGKLLVGNDVGAVYCLEILPNNNLKECWKYQTKGKIASSPMVHNNCVFISSEDNFIHKLDFNSGEKLLEQKTTSFPRSFVINDNKLLALSDKGQVECYTL